jgi:hypothetical protein
MNAQQAVAKRSVGRRVTLLDAPFFCPNGRLQNHPSDLLPAHASMSRIHPREAPRAACLH